MILRRATRVQRGCRRAVICLEGLCDILRKWLFLFVQCSCDCMGGWRWRAANPRQCRGGFVPFGQKRDTSSSLSEQETVKTRFCVDKSCHLHCNNEDLWFPVLRAGRISTVLYFTVEHCEQRKCYYEHSWPKTHYSPVSNYSITAIF